MYSQSARERDDAVKAARRSVFDAEQAMSAAVDAAAAAAETSINECRRRCDERIDECPHQCSLECSARHTECEQRCTNAGAAVAAAADRERKCATATQTLRERDDACRRLEEDLVIRLTMVEKVEREAAELGR
jgi:hypothetical protein